MEQLGVLTISAHLYPKVPLLTYKRYLYLLLSLLLSFQELCVRKGDKDPIHISYYKLQGSHPALETVLWAMVSASYSFPLSWTLFQGRHSAVSLPTVRRETLTQAQDPGVRPGLSPSDFGHLYSFPCCFPFKAHNFLIFSQYLGIDFGFRQLFSIL